MIRFTIAANQPLPGSPRLKGRIERDVREHSPDAKGSQLGEQEYFFTVTDSVDHWPGQHLRLTTRLESNSVSGLINRLKFEAKLMGLELSTSGADRLNVGNYEEAIDKIKPSRS